MRPITAEWIAKAEGDYVTAKRELQVEDHANYDAVCFHAQQCAEKYLKARLVEEEIGFPKTHDLGALLTRLAPVEPEWELLRSEVNGLTTLAVEVRYPGMSAGGEDAKEAVRIAEDVRRRVRGSLGLSLEEGE